MTRVMIDGKKVTLSENQKARLAAIDEDLAVNDRLLKRGEISEHQHARWRRYHERERAEHLRECARANAKG